MPNFDDIYSGQYAASTDAVFQPLGRRLTAVIHEVERKEVGQERRPRVILTLVSPTGQLWPKPVVLNKTNYERLKAVLGPETDDWLGKAITIWTEPVSFQGRAGWGIRLMAAVQQLLTEPAPGPQLTAKPVKARGSSRSKPVPPPVTDAELDDEVPF